MTRQNIVHTLEWRFHPTWNGTWKHHIKSITGKAKKTLYFLQRNLYNCPPEVKTQSYISLVRPTLEYAASCWDPHRQKDIDTLEAVQRKAARFISNNFRRRTSVTARLTNLDLQSLQQRREASRLSMLYKLHHNQVQIQIPDHFIGQDISTMKTRSKHEFHHSKDRYLQVQFLPPDHQTLEPVATLNNKCTYCTDIQHFGPASYYQPSN